MRIAKCIKHVIENMIKIGVSEIQEQFEAFAASEHIEQS